MKCPNGLGDRVWNYNLYNLELYLYIYNCKGKYDIVFIQIIYFFKEYYNNLCLCLLNLYQMMIGIILQAIEIMKAFIWYEPYHMSDVIGAQILEWYFAWELIFKKNPAVNVRFDIEWTTWVHCTRRFSRVFTVIRRTSFRRKL